MDKKEIPKGKKCNDAEIDPAVLEKEREKRRTETNPSKFMGPPLDYKSEGPGS